MIKAIDFHTFGDCYVECGRYADGKGGKQIRYRRYNNPTGASLNRLFTLWTYYRLHSVPHTQAFRSVGYVIERKVAE